MLAFWLGVDIYEVDFGRLQTFDVIMSL